MRFKSLVILVLALILVSLGTALFHLSSKKGSSEGMARALSWRIGLSVTLFALLILAYYQGWITPAH